MNFFLALSTLDILLIILLVAFGVLAPLIALIDVLRSDFKAQNDKLVWVLVILFMSLLGVLLYLAIGIHQKAKTKD